MGRCGPVVMAVQALEGSRVRFPGCPYLFDMVDANGIAHCPFLSAWNRVGVKMKLSVSMTDKKGQESDDSLKESDDSKLESDDSE